MLPALTPTSFSTRILFYLASPSPPPDGASMQLGQRLPTALRGLKFTVICNRSCMSTATATIAGKLAGRLGLASANAENKPYPVGTAALPAGTGRRTLTIAFRR